MNAENTVVEICIFINLSVRAEWRDFKIAWACVCAGVHSNATPKTGEYSVDYRPHKVGPPHNNTAAGRAAWLRLRAGSERLLHDYVAE